MKVNSVFDSFPWWDPQDVLTQITPARYRYLERAAGQLGGQRVLDLGCGGGLLAEPMSRAGARVTGIDSSASALAVARDHATRSDLSIEYTQARAERLPFRTASFDTVVAFDVLEHLDDLPMAMAEISRVLRLGGRLVYDTMNRTLVCLIAVVWIGERLWPGGPPSGTHIWRKFPKPEELVDLMARNGIANMETRGFMPAGVDLRGNLQMRLAPFQWISYVGWGIRE